MDCVWNVDANNKSEAGVFLETLGTGDESEVCHCYFD